MSTSLSNRAAAIRAYLAKMGADPVVARRYSLIAARWEELRIATDRGATTPADDARSHELSDILKALTAELALPTGDDADSVPGITGWRGFLPGDPERIICDDWREAASGW